MGYCLILDAEISEGKHREANEIACKVAEQLRNVGANLEVFTPLTGNQHHIFAIFRLDTLSEYEELMKRAGCVEELVQLEHQFFSLLKRPVHNLYSTLS
jgi:hypothetical protein